METKPRGDEGSKEKAAIAEVEVNAVSARAPYLTGGPEPETVFRCKTCRVDYVTILGKAYID
jgi:hypothetical protein